MIVYKTTQIPINIPEGVSVSVYVEGTSELANLFDRDNAPLSNPIFTDVNGEFFFKCAEVTDITIGGSESSADAAWNEGNSYTIYSVVFVSPDYPEDSQVKDGVIFSNTTREGTLGASTGDGFEATRSAIESWFKVLWSSRTPILFSNVEDDSVQNTVYTVLTINDAEGQRASIGKDSLTLHAGIIQVLIITQKNKGTSTIRKLADDVYDIFNQQQISGLVCGVPYKSAEFGYDDKYQITMNIPFRRYK